MIGLLDPSLGTANSGDIIISRAVRSLIAEADIEFKEFSTRAPWDRVTRRSASGCDFFVMGGTNILTSDPREYRQWLLGWRDFPAVRKRTVLLGVGWWQYQAPPTLLGRLFLREALHPAALHSVRDAFTESMLAYVGLRTTNTACPTMWSLDGVNSPAVSTCSRVVATVTDYARDAQRDILLLDQLNNMFDEVVIWPQGSQDRIYLERLGRREAILPGGLDAYYEALSVPSTAYVGTRLHAGVAALALGVPSLIVGIDNRATEIAADTGLPIIQRSSIETLSQRAKQNADKIVLPKENIARWRSAFAELLTSDCG